MVLHSTDKARSDWVSDWRVEKAAEPTSRILREPLRFYVVVVIDLLGTSTSNNSHSIKWIRFFSFCGGGGTAKYWLGGKEEGKCLSLFLSFPFVIERPLSLCLFSSSFFARSSRNLLREGKKEGTNDGFSSIGTKPLPSSFFSFSLPNSAWLQSLPVSNGRREKKRKADGYGCIVIV